MVRLCSRSYASDKEFILHTLQALLDGGYIGVVGAPISDVETANYRHLRYRLLVNKSDIPEPLRHFLIPMVGNFCVDASKYDKWDLNQIQDLVSGKTDVVRDPVNGWRVPIWDVAEMESVIFYDAFDAFFGLDDKLGFMTFSSTSDHSVTEFGDYINSWLAAVGADDSIIRANGKNFCYRGSGVPNYTADYFCGFFGYVRNGDQMGNSYYAHRGRPFVAVRFKDPLPGGKGNLFGGHYMYGTLDESEFKGLRLPKLVDGVYRAPDEYAAYNVTLPFPMMSFGDCEKGYKSDKSLKKTATDTKELARKMFSANRWGLKDTRDITGEMICRDITSGIDSFRFLTHLRSGVPFSLYSHTFNVSGYRVGGRFDDKGNAICMSCGSRMRSIVSYAAYGCGYRVLYKDSVLKTLFEDYLGFKSLRDFINGCEGVSGYSKVPEYTIDEFLVLASWFICTYHPEISISWMTRLCADQWLCDVAGAMKVFGVDYDTDVAGIRWAIKLWMFSNFSVVPATMFSRSAEDVSGAGGVGSSGVAAFTSVLDPCGDKYKVLVDPVNEDECTLLLVGVNTVNDASAGILNVPNTYTEKGKTYRVTGFGIGSSLGADIDKVAGVVFGSNLHKLYSHTLASDAAASVGFTSSHSLGYVDLSACVNLDFIGSKFFEGCEFLDFKFPVGTKDLIIENYAFRFCKFRQENLRVVCQQVGSNAFRDCVFRMDGAVLDVHAAKVGQNAFRGVKVSSLVLDGGLVEEINADGLGSVDGVLSVGNMPLCKYLARGAFRNGRFSDADISIGKDDVPLSLGGVVFECATGGGMDGKLKVILQPMEVSADRGAFIGNLSNVEFCVHINTPIDIICNGRIPGGHIHIESGVKDLSVLWGSICAAEASKLSDLETMCRSGLDMYDKGVAALLAGQEPLTLDVVTGLDAGVLGDFSGAVFEDWVGATRLSHLVDGLTEMEHHKLDVDVIEAFRDTRDANNLYSVDSETYTYKLKSRDGSPVSLEVADTVLTSITAFGVCLRYVVLTVLNDDPNGVDEPVWGFWNYGGAKDGDLYVLSYDDSRRVLKDTLGDGAGSAGQGSQTLISKAADVPYFGVRGMRVPFFGLGDGVHDGYHALNMNLTDDEFANLVSAYVREGIVCGVAGSEEYLVTLPVLGFSGWRCISQSDGWFVTSMVQGADGLNSLDKGIRPRNNGELTKALMKLGAAPVKGTAGVASSMHTIALYGGSNGGTGWTVATLEGLVGEYLMLAEPDRKVVGTENSRNTLDDGNTLIVYASENRMAASGGAAVRLGNGTYAYKVYDTNGKIIRCFLSFMPFESSEPDVPSLKSEILSIRASYGDHAGAFTGLHMKPDLGDSALSRFIAFKDDRCRVAFGHKVGVPGVGTDGYVSVSVFLDAVTGYWCYRIDETGDVLFYVRNVVEFMRVLLARKGAAEGRDRYTFTARLDDLIRESIHLDGLKQPVLTDDSPLAAYWDIQDGKRVPVVVSGGLARDMLGNYGKGLLC